MEEMKSDGKGSRSDFLGPRFRALSKSRISGKYCKWRLQAWNRRGGHLLHWKDVQEALLFTLELLLGMTGVCKPLDQTVLRAAIRFKLSASGSNRRAYFTQEHAAPGVFSQ
jgi:hypothetical protein